MTDKPTWWDKGTSSEWAGPSAFAACRAIEQCQAEYHQLLLDNARLYHNRELLAFDWGGGALGPVSMSPVTRLSENLVLSVGDTMVSQIGKNKVKATPTTRGASFKTRRAAKRLDKFLYGQFRYLDAWHMAKLAFRDSFWAGVGTLHGYWTKKKGVGHLHLERVFPDELVVDQMECAFSAKPKTIYRRRVMPAAELAARFEGYQAELDQPRYISADGYNRNPAEGYVVVVEAYRLPCHGVPGRHTIGTENQTLEDEEWKHNWLPYVHYFWQEPLSGFYPPSGVEQVIPYQLDLNRVNLVIRDGQDLMVRPRLWVPPGAKVNLGQVDNRIGKIIVSAVEPKPLMWPGAGPELYSERDRIVRTCFEYFGLTQLSSQGKLPQGARLDSSEALREYNAIEDQRFADPAQRYEKFQLDIAHLLLNLAEDAHSRGARMESTWVMGKRAEVVNWDDIDYDADKYVFSLEASSTMNETPAAKKDRVKELTELGVLGPEQAKMLLGHPDIDREMSLLAAAAEDIERVIDLLESGKWEMPTELQDLIGGCQRLQLHYLYLMSEYDDVPDEVLQSFMDWIAIAQGILEEGAKRKSPEDAMPAGGGAPVQPQLPLGSPQSIPGPQGAMMPPQGMGPPIA
jgi:hypothetical protein